MFAHQCAVGHFTSAYSAFCSNAMFCSGSHTSSGVPGHQSQPNPPGPCFHQQQSLLPPECVAFDVCDFDQLPKNVHRLRVLQQLLADECRFCPIRLHELHFSLFAAADFFSGSISSREVFGSYRTCGLRYMSVI
jgi:hypothetical protein